MAEVIKVFMGAMENWLEVDSLEASHRQSLAEGFVPFKNAVRLGIALEGKVEAGSTMVIRGAQTGQCVAAAVNFGVRNEMSEIIVDLQNCRNGQSDLGLGQAAIESRRRECLEGVKEEYRSDPRIKFAW